MSLQSFLKKLESETKFETKESSGSSVVYYSEDSKFIYQEFRNSKVFEKICKLMFELLRQEVSLKILFKKITPGKPSVTLLNKTLTYNSFDYLVKFNYCIPTHLSVVWDKIYTLNTLKKDKLKTFILNNLYKLLYDISKGLYTLHSKGILHNDCVVDNVGIQDNKHGANFVLFDFDAIGTPEDKGKLFQSDYSSFIRSINFNTDMSLKFKYSNPSSVIQYVSENETISLEESFQMLEKMKIVFSDD
jgi:hypothetical protein